MFLFSIAMGAPLRALRGRSAINTIKNTVRYTEDFSRDIEVH